MIPAATSSTSRRRRNPATRFKFSSDCRASAPGCSDTVALLLGTASDAPEPARSTVRSPGGRAASGLKNRGGGKYLDVDLDSPEAVVIGGLWLPETGMSFGRASKRGSHFLYRGGTQFRREFFTDPEVLDTRPAMLLELRGTGHQTMCPPSRHPSGEVVEWERFDAPSVIDASIALSQLLHAWLPTAASAVIRFASSM
jgi:hypothetical protein